MAVEPRRMDSPVRRAKVRQSPKIVGSNSPPSRNLDRLSLMYVCVFCLAYVRFCTSSRSNLANLCPLSQRQACGLGQTADFKEVPRRTKRLVLPSSVSFSTVLWRIQHSQAFPKTKPSFINLPFPEAWVPVTFVNGEPHLDRNATRRSLTGSGGRRMRLAY